MHNYQKLMKSLVVMAAVALPWVSRAAPSPTVYPVNLPANVRIVQNAPVDNVRTFSTIAAALQSITNASATNPYLVKVMPGIFTEQFLYVPAFVTVEGSGVEATVVDGAFVVGGGQFNTLGGTVANLTINGCSGANTDGVFRRVHISSASGRTGCLPYVYGLNVYGTNIQILDSVIDAGNDGIGVGVTLGSFVMKGAKVTANTGINLEGYGPYSVDIDGSDITAAGVVINANSQAHRVTVRNSTMSGTGMLSPQAQGGVVVNVANSQVPNPSGLRAGTDRMVNCFEGAFNPVPNL